MATQLDAGKHSGNRASARFRVIAAYIEEGIRNGRFDVSRRLPSEAELADQFRASRTTVVRAMQDLQASGLIERRVGSGTFVRQNGAAAKSQSLPLAPLGLIVAGLGNTEILDPICAEITHRSESQGYIVLRGDPSLNTSQEADFSPIKAEALVRHFIDRKVEGVFFAPLELPDDRETINRRIADSLVKAGIAVVLLDRDITEFPTRSEFDLVGIDNFAAGYELGQHLVQAGWRRIRFVANTHYPSTTDLRMAGCREALLSNGMPFEKDWAHFGNPSDPEFVRHLLDTGPPDAVICSNDRTAAMLIQTLTDLQIRTPDNIGIAGFDDVRYATLLSTPLTTMRQPCREIGDLAVQLMIDRLNKRPIPPRMVLLPTKLIARRSTQRSSPSIAR